MHQVGLVVKDVEQVAGADQAAQVHVAADEVLADDPAAGGAGLGLSHARVEVVEATGRVDGESPLHVFLPGSHVLDGMVHVLGHEAGAAPFEAEHVAAGVVLDELVVAAIFEHLRLEDGSEGSFAPAELPKRMLGKRFVAEELREVGIGGESVALLPGIEAIEAELALDERGARGQIVEVAGAACGAVHPVARHGLVYAGQHGVCRIPHSSLTSCNWLAPGGCAPGAWSCVAHPWIQLLAAGDLAVFVDEQAFALAVAPELLVGAVAHAHLGLEVHPERPVGVPPPLAAVGLAVLIGELT